MKGTNKKRIREIRENENPRKITKLNKELHVKSTSEASVLCDNCEGIVSASYANHVDCLNKFLHSAGSINENNTNVTQEKRRKALLSAIGQGNVKCVKILLESNSNEVNSEITEIAPLHMCAGVGHTGVMKELIKRGADVNLVLKKDQLTPLHICAAFGTTECLELLLKFGGNPLLQTSDSSMNALHFAAYHGHYECVKIFHKYGIDINATSAETNRTALHYAAVQGKLNCFQYLVENGADKHILDVNGHSPLVYAANGKQGLEILAFYPFQERKKWLTVALVNVDTPCFTLSSIRQNLLQGFESQFLEFYSNINFSTIFNRIPFLQISFKNEIGEGYGVSREWFSELSYEFLPYFQFNSSTGTYFFHQKTPENQSNGKYKALGYLFAIALIHGHIIPMQLSKIIFKMLLNIPIIPKKDIKFVDLDIYQAKIKYLRKATNEQITSLELYFCSNDISSLDGSIEETPLLENGENILVRKENLEQYLDLICSHKLFHQRQSKITDFVSAFHEVIPADLLNKLFKQEELELALCGEYKLDLADWKSSTIYDQCDEDAIEIQWFWEVVGALSDDEKKILLSFCTGCQHLPVGGFAQLKIDRFPFTIQLQPIIDPLAFSLPSSRTCFNTLILPKYPSKSMLLDKLKLTLHAQTHGIGFGFV